MKWALYSFFKVNSIKLSWQIEKFSVFRTLQSSPRKMKQQTPIENDFSGAFLMNY